MVDAGHQAAFPHHLRIGGVVWLRAGHQLERHLAIVFQVVREKNRGHASTAELAPDLICARKGLLEAV